MNKRHPDGEYIPDVDYSVVNDEDIVMARITTIRAKQRRRWSAEHDAQHEAWEWLGLVATYAAAGRWEDAAALCVAARLAEGPVLAR